MALNKLGKKLMTFINNIKNVLGKIFIFRTKSAKFLHRNRFKHFLKHHFIIELHIADKKTN